MMPGSKVNNHVVLAHKCLYDLVTRPNMRIKVGRKPHDIRILGRIVGVQSTEQSVGIIVGAFDPNIILLSLCDMPDHLTAPRSCTWTFRPRFLL